MSSKPTTSVPVPDIKKRGVSGFITDVKHEMKHVKWPSRAETTRLTGVVLAVCFMAVVLLYSLGELFGLTLEQLLKLRG